METRENTSQKIYAKYIPSAKLYDTVTEKDASKVGRVTYEFCNTIFTFDPTNHYEVAEVLDFYLGTDAMEYDKENAEAIIASILHLIPRNLLEDNEIFELLMQQKTDLVLNFILANNLRWTPALLSILVQHISIKVLPQSFLRPILKYSQFRTIVQDFDCGFETSLEAALYIENVLPTNFWLRKNISC